MADKPKSTESPQQKYERKQLKKHGVIPRPVVCDKCGKGGGTLVKAGGAIGNASQIKLLDAMEVTCTEHGPFHKEGFTAKRFCPVCMAELRRELE